MKIKIPNKILREAGIKKVDASRLIFEVTEIADRVPTCVTGSKFPKGVVIMVDEWLGKSK